MRRSKDTTEHAPKMSPPKPARSSLHYGAHEASFSAAKDRPGATLVRPATVLPSVERAITHLSGGEPLQPELRSTFELRWGHDFSRVRVHHDETAAASAAALGARAFTHGADVVFGRGQWAPHSPVGRELMDHELGHVAAQSERDQAIVQLARLSDFRVSSLENPEQVSEAQIRATEEYRAYVDSTLVWQWRDHVTAEEALLACRLILDALRNGQRVNWEVDARAFMNKARAQLKKEADEPPNTVTEKRPTHEVLRLSETIPIQGSVRNQSNYVDRSIGRIESAPLLPDLTLIPRGGQAGITLPKAEFHIDSDPLAGLAIDQNRVYRSRAVAEAVMADLNRISPDMPSYVYYEQNGVILPTVLSTTTIPNLLPFVRQKREQDRADLQATADLAKALAVWYVSTRFPIKVGRGAPAAPVKEAGKRAAGGTAAVAFDAAKVADDLFNATQAIVNPGQRMLAAAKQLSAMGGLNAAQKVQAIQEFFKRIGFAIGKQGVVDEGARFVMYAEDARYAFAFLKDTGEILYARFDTKLAKYVWEALK